MNSESHILQSWQQNAAAWTEVIRKNTVKSRTLVTNQAVVQAVMDCQPQSVLDVGCGEGWLTRTLAGQGVSTLGIDATPSLIGRAQQADHRARYRVGTYHDIVAGCLRNEPPFDVMVCNFSLLGQASVEALVRYLPRILSPNGHFIIQTLHPLTANGDDAYRDGWRTGSWQGFSGDFVNPAPWYFRTLSSWVQLLTRSGFVLKAVQEPVHPRTQQPASILFVGRISGR